MTDYETDQPRDNTYHTRDDARKNQFSHIPELGLTLVEQLLQMIEIITQHLQVFIETVVIFILLGKTYLGVLTTA